MVEDNLTASTRDAQQRHKTWTFVSDDNWTIELIGGHWHLEARRVRPYDGTLTYTSADKDWALSSRKRSECNLSHREVLHKVADGPHSSIDHCDVGSLLRRARRVEYEVVVGCIENTEDDIVADVNANGECGDWQTLADRLDDRDRLEADCAQAWDSWAHSPSGLTGRR